MDKPSQPTEEKQPKTATSFITMSPLLSPSPLSTSQLTARAAEQPGSRSQGVECDASAHAKRKGHRAKGNARRIAEGGRREGRWRKGERSDGEKGDERREVRKTGERTNSAE